MLVLSFNIINKIRERQNLQEFSNIYLYFLVVFYLIFYTKFYIFSVYFHHCKFIHIILIKNRKNKIKSKSNCCILCYRNIFVFSFFCWILDQLFCEYVKQFHLVRNMAHRYKY